MYVDSHGIQVEPVRPIDRSPELAERFRDILAVKLHAKKMPLRWIGIVLGLSGKTIHERLEKMPDDARDYFRRTALEDLVPSLAD